MEGGAGNASGFDLAWAVWRRRKWLAVLVLAISSFAAVSLVMFLPDLYRATATVLVEREQVSESFVKSPVTGEIETRLHTLIQEILSRARLKELITRFDLYPNMRKNGSADGAVEQMRRDIKIDLKKVEPTGDRSPTIAFALSYRGRDPKTVADVTNSLASFYVEENLKVREQQTTEATSFLRTQLDEAKRRLERQEQRMGEFRKRFLGELPQQVDSNRSSLARLDAQLRLNGDLQIRAMDRKERLEKQISEADPSSAEATLARLARLNQELSDLRMRFTEIHPSMIRVKEEIASVESQLAEIKAGRPASKTLPPVSPAVVKLKDSLAGVTEEIKRLDDEERAIRQSIGTYQRRIESAPLWEQQYQEMSRDYDTMKSLYASLLGRYEEAQLAESLEQRNKRAQFRVLDQAIPPTDPSAPNRLRLILTGLMLSVGLTLGAVVLAEIRDHSFHSADDLKTYTRVPVVLSIPRIITAGDRARRRRRLVLSTASALLGLALAVGVSYYVAHENDGLTLMLGRDRS